MATHIVRNGVRDDATGWFNGRKLVRLSDGVTLWCIYEFPGVNDEIRASYSLDGGITWIEEVVSAGADDYFYPAMAVDSLDRLHVTYLNTTTNQIEYRVRNGAWSAAQVVEALVSDEPCIAIDSADNVHISYIAVHPIHNRYNIRYRENNAIAGWQAAEWVTEILPPGWAQYYPAIAIDSSDNVHLVWQGDGWGVNDENYNIQYRKRTPGGWQLQEGITDKNYQQWHPTIAIDLSDNVHVSWYGTWAGGGRLNYRKRTAVAWEAEEMIALYPYLDPNIALDLAGTIYVLYYWDYGGNYWVRRARKELGGSWGHATVEAAAYDNIYPIAMWALHPTISGVKTNIRDEGYLLVFSADVPASPEVRYHSSTVTPVVTTDPATGITADQATLNGTLDDDGGEACDCGFEWGEPHPR